MVINGVWREPTPGSLHRRLGMVGRSPLPSAQEVLGEEETVGGALTECRSDARMHPLVHVIGGCDGDVRADLLFRMRYLHRSVGDERFPCTESNAGTMSNHAS